jgi:hypothetical protein
LAGRAIAFVAWTDMVIVGPPRSGGSFGRVISEPVLIGRTSGALRRGRTRPLLIRR